MPHLTRPQCLPYCHTDSLNLPNPGHNALYACKHFKAGEVIMAFSYRSMCDYPTYLTVQVRACLAGF